MWVNEIEYKNKRLCSSEKYVIVQYNIWISPLKISLSVFTVTDVFRYALILPVANRASSVPLVHQRKIVVDYFTKDARRWNGLSSKILFVRILIQNYRSCIISNRKCKVFSLLLSRRSRLNIWISRNGSCCMVILNKRWTLLIWSTRETTIKYQVPLLTRWSQLFLWMSKNRLTRTSTCRSVSKYRNSCRGYYKV